MRIRQAGIACVVGAVLALAAVPASEAGDGTGQGAENSRAADLCRQGGYETLVGSDGTTFASSGACVSFAAHGGTFGSGIVIPAGRTATISNARWNLRPCDALTYGYQLDFGANVPLASNQGGLCLNADLPNATIGPFAKTTLLRIFLTDSGYPGALTSCDYTFYSDGAHALVTGSNPWQIDIADSDFCTAPPTSADAPGPGGGNLDLTLTIS